MIPFIERDYIKKKSGLSICTNQPQVKSKNASSAQNLRGFLKEHLLGSDQLVVISVYPTGCSRALTSIR